MTLSLLQQWDTAVLLWCNQFHTPWLDEVMYAVSQQAWLWTPLYLLLAFLLYRKYGRRCVVMILCFVVMVIFTDQFSSAVIKPWVARLRPTHELSVASLIHTVKDYRGGMYGFVSSHAANSFAVAVLASLLLWEKGWTMLFFLWACVLSFSRIYLGVHYPGDVIGGAVLGILTAFAMYAALKRIFRKIYGNDLHSFARQ